MHRKRQSSSTSSSGGSNGLVLLYEAAMMIEQQNIRAPIVKAAFPLTTSLAKPMLSMHPSRNQSVSRGPAAKVPLTYSASQHPAHSVLSTSARVRLEPNGHGAYQIVGADVYPQQQQQQQQQQLVTIHQGVAVSSSVGKRAASSAANSGQHNSRTSHNELEKNRRAHLRQCLDILRDQLPLSQSEATRLTMLSVLTKSHAYLKELQSLDARQKHRLVAQQRRQRELLHRREQLKRTLRSLRKRLAASGEQQQQQAGAAAARLSRNRRQAGQRPQQQQLATSSPRKLPAAQPAAVQWRYRTASAISAASASSEDMTVAAHTAAAAAISAGASVTSEPRRGGSCGTPDSGYASPPNCSGSGLPPVSAPAEASS